MNDDECQLKNSGLLVANAHGKINDPNAKIIDAKDEIIGCDDGESDLDLRVLVGNDEK